jgi:hypothetical protein
LPFKHTTNCLAALSANYTVGQRSQLLQLLQLLHLRGKTAASITNHTFEGG